MRMAFMFAIMFRRAYVIYKTMNYSKKEDYIPKN